MECSFIFIFSMNVFHILISSSMLIFNVTQPLQRGSETKNRHWRRYMLTIGWPFPVLKLTFYRWRANIIFNQILCHVIILSFVCVFVVILFFFLLVWRYLIKYDHEMLYFGCFLWDVITFFSWSWSCQVFFYVYDRLVS